MLRPSARIKSSINPICIPPKHKKRDLPALWQISLVISYGARVPCTQDVGPITPESALTTPLTCGYYTMIWAGCQGNFPVFPSIWSKSVRRLPRHFSALFSRRGRHTGAPRATGRRHTRAAGRRTACGHRRCFYRPGLRGKFHHNALHAAGEGHLSLHIAILFDLTHIIADQPCPAQS